MTDSQRYKRAWNRWKKLYPVHAHTVEWKCRDKEEKPKESWYLMMGFLNAAVVSAMDEMDKEKLRKINKMLRNHEKIEIECGLRNTGPEAF